MQDKIKTQDLYTAAKLLIDADTASEYTRGVCELIAEVDGKTEVSHADRSLEVAIELGVPEGIIKQMW